MIKKNKNNLMNLFCVVVMRQFLSNELQLQLNHSTISNLICIGLIFQLRHLRSYMMFLCTSEAEPIKYVLDWRKFV